VRKEGVVKRVLDRKGRGNVHLHPPGKDELGASGLPHDPKHLATGVGAAGGAAAGAAAGAFTGPIGAAVGAVIGAAAGAAGAAAVEEAESARMRHDEELDEEIGVLGGDMGTRTVPHPPLRIGAFSAASMGVGAAEEDITPDEGPIPKSE
jgi:hypothetical protein